MKTSRSFLSLSACLLTAGAGADSLDVTATAEAVRIAPGIAERRAVPLPGLEIDVFLDARCSAASPATITLASADTRRSISGDSLLAALIDGVRFSIPARQLPPVSSKGFCVSELGLDQPLSLAKPGFLSLYATLRCLAPEGQDGAAVESLTTNTVIVDVAIECDRELLEAAQDPSASASDRKSSVRIQD